MKKSFGIFIIMGLILVCGTTITAFTKHYFGSRLMQTEQVSQVFTEVGFAEEPLDESLLEAEPGDVDLRSLTAGGEETGAKLPETDFAVPFDSAMPSRIGDEQSLAPIEAREQYVQKLQELEDDLQAHWEGEDAGTTNGMMAVAEYELAAWDLELNIIYQLLRDKLPAEEFDIIKLEEREWVKERDAIATAAAAEYENGTIEGLTYTKTLTEETRKRTYILVGYYFPEE